MQIVLSVVTALLLLSFVIPTPAMAWYGCGSTYVVQRGDTLSAIARMCGTSVAAIRQANPYLGYYIYAGQTLYMPGGDPGYYPPYDPNYYPPSGSGTYVVQRGDSLRKIAASMGLCVGDLIAANPQLWNPNLIYAGQVIYLPSGGAYYCSGYNPGGYSTGYQYTVQWGDTLRLIAARYGTTVNSLVALNPQIWNPHWIYAGQVIRIR